MYNFFIVLSIYWSVEKPFNFRREFYGYRNKKKTVCLKHVWLSTFTFVLIKFNLHYINSRKKKPCVLECGWFYKELFKFNLI